MNKFKKNDGFTLIEVIFSVAFLCIVSVIVLRLFVASYEIESRTEKIDMATLHMFNEIEDIKSLENIEDESRIVEVYYDGMWKEVDKEESNFQILIIVSKNSSNDRGLFDIKGSVIELKTKESITSIETMHYYNQKE